MELVYQIHKNYKGYLGVSKDKQSAVVIIPIACHIVPSELNLPDIDVFYPEVFDFVCQSIDWKATPELKSTDFTCVKCRGLFTNHSAHYYDKFYKQDLCFNCFNKRLGEELKASNSKWFDANIEPTEKPPRTSRNGPGRGDFKNVNERACF